MNECLVRMETGSVWLRQPCCVVGVSRWTTSIACSGHAGTHSPQRVHLPSMTSCFRYGLASMAFNGHTCAQTVQPEHDSSTR